MDIQHTLEKFIAPTSATGLAALASIVDGHMVEVRSTAEIRDFVDVDLAARVVATLHTLLAEADEYTARERALLAGAVRYFVENADIDADLASPTGFEDDAGVLNAVCAFLGRPDLTVQIE